MLPVVMADRPWAGSLTSLSASFLLENGSRDPDITGLSGK